MKYILPEQIETEHIMYDITGLAQFWEEGGSWSFLESPRINSGFMLVLCDRVCISEKGEEPVTYHYGDLLYIPQYARYNVSFYGTHEEYTDIQTNFYIRDLDGEEYCFADKITLLCTDPSFRMAKDFYDEMYHICRYTDNLKYPCLKIRRAFYTLLQKILAYRAQSDLKNRENSAISAALFYVDSHIGDNISVQELSKMCLMSESAFRKAFKSYTGYSPAQYKIRAKIAKAQVILASSSEISIAEIADRLGFYDVAYFYKVFENQTGMTPKEYRDAAIG